MKKYIALGLVAAAAAVFAKDFEMTAPMETKSGKHHAAVCIDKQNGDAIAWNTRETTVVWRAFGANTYEFKDMATGQQRALKESEKDRYHCRTIKYV